MVTLNTFFWPQEQGVSNSCPPGAYIWRNNRQLRWSRTVCWYGVRCEGHGEEHIVGTGPFLVRPSGWWVVLGGARWSVNGLVSFTLVLLLLPGTSHGNSRRNTTYNHECWWLLLLLFWLCCIRGHASWCCYCSCCRCGVDEDADFDDDEDDGYCGAWYVDYYDAASSPTTTQTDMVTVSSLQS